MNSRSRAMRRLFGWSLFAVSATASVAWSPRLALGGSELRQRYGPKEKRRHSLRKRSPKDGSRLLYRCGRTGRTRGGSELHATSGVRPGRLAASGSPTAPRQGTGVFAPSSTSCAPMALIRAGSHTTATAISIPLGRQVEPGLPLKSGGDRHAGDLDDECRR